MSAGAPPRTPPSRGEFVTLRDHFESRLQAIEKSIDVANNAMQTRLSGMNEFRDTLKDQAARFVTRDEMKREVDVLHQQVRLLEESKNILAGKASQNQVNVALIMSAIGLIIAVAGFIMKL